MSLNNQITITSDIVNKYNQYIYDKKTCTELILNLILCILIIIIPIIYSIKLIIDKGTFLFFVYFYTVIINIFYNLLINIVIAIYNKYYGFITNDYNVLNLNEELIEKYIITKINETHVIHLIIIFIGDIILFLSVPLYKLIIYITYKYFNIDELLIIYIIFIIIIIKLNKIKFIWTALYNKFY